MSGAFILVLLFLAFLIIPNNGEKAPIDKFFEWLDGRGINEESLKHKGDKEFILKMINDDIQKDNDRDIEIMAMGFKNRDLTKKITDIDPYKRYIFHGGCHGCIVPERDSISMCLGCQYYNRDLNVSLYEGKDNEKL